MILSLIAFSCQSNSQEKTTTVNSGENVLKKYTSKNMEVEYLNLGKCNFEVVEIIELREIMTDEGLLKPDGNNKLLKVKILGVTSTTGSCIVTPISFNCVFNYRRTVASVSSLAFGSIGTSKSTGNFAEVWFQADDVRSIVEIDEGEKFPLYMLFELPKEVDNIAVQVPLTIN